MQNKRKKIKILLVDDHPLVRLGIKAELKRNKDFDVIGEAISGESAVKKGTSLKPDVILLDIALPDVSGLEIVPALRKKLPKVKIIALTMHNNINYITEMIKLGAEGYVLKDSPPEELEEAIYKVLTENKYYCSGTRIIQKKEASRRIQIQAPENLTLREKQILIHLAGGDTNKEIAKKLFLSVRTVEAHRNKIKSKLKLHTAADLTRYAIFRKWVET